MKTKTKGVTEIDRIVGARVRQLRLQLDMSQERLGEVVGVSFQQIQKYEKGVNRISVSRLMQFVTALETTPNEIVGFNEKVVAGNVHSATIFSAASEFSSFPKEVQILIRKLCIAIGQALPKKKR